MFHSKLVIEQLGKHHDRAAFDCGIEELGHYIRVQASQDIKKKVTATFVLAGVLPAIIVGYYSLSSTIVKVKELPEQVAKKLPRYPTMPATLIGRLAVDRRYQGSGYGELLLMDALKRSLISTEQIGSVAVIVEAKNDKAKAFYEHFQFIPLVNYSYRLFLPMIEIQDFLA
ncbi:MAG: GNAT family N-acetyltransferase [Nitrospirae bacterium]|nr:GNAT family N-acetyltransferase [Nitrospirota bacterium]